jgi:hypothetical protein
MLEYDCDADHGSGGDQYGSNGDEEVQRKDSCECTSYCTSTKILASRRRSAQVDAVAVQVLRHGHASQCGIVTSNTERLVSFSSPLPLPFPCSCRCHRRERGRGLSRGHTYPGSA